MTMPILTFDIDEMYHVPYICYIDTHIDKSWRPSCTFGWHSLCAPCPGLLLLLVGVRPRTEDPLGRPGWNSGGLQIPGRDPRQTSRRWVPNSDLFSDHAVHHASHFKTAEAVAEVKSLEHTDTYMCKHTQVESTALALKMDYARALIREATVNGVNDRVFMERQVEMEARRLSNRWEISALKNDTG